VFSRPERLPDDDLVRARRPKLAQAMSFFDNANGWDLRKIDLNCAVEPELVKKRRRRCKHWIAVLEFEGAEPGLHFLGADPSRDDPTSQ
jgi:hypothetical protein